MIRADESNLHEISSKDYNPKHIGKTRKSVKTRFSEQTIWWCTNCQCIFTLFNFFASSSVFFILNRIFYLSRTLSNRATTFVCIWQ